MPEGDTIFRAAQTLHRALAGRPIVRFESVLPALTRVDTDHPIAGRRMESVSSRGKHLLMHLSGGLVLHTHMRMNGAWHVYRPGERWQRPAREMRIVLVTAERVAVGFNIPIAEFVTATALSRHPQLARLGPDLADPAFDPAVARARIQTHGAEPIADVLLNQRVLSGIGNVLKSEILFVAGVHPFARANELSGDRLGQILDAARQLMAMNMKPHPSPGRGRRTTGSMDPARQLWVYGRGGKPCRRCGSPIESRATGVDARLTYWCPRCQS
jgi:endonuclease-8